MKTKILMLIILPVIFLASASFVHAHFLGYSAVDAGEIRWGGSTQYSNEWNAGIATWNALGKVNIAPDNIWTYEDLKVRDINDIDLFRTGQYLYFSGNTDFLELNIAYLYNDTSAQKQNTATHELGHSLGLNHGPYGSIMYQDQTSQTNLGSHDISDYNSWY